ncbi:MAG: hypothetical protein WC975_07440 [Phycisphaerae bacterium]
MSETSDSNRVTLESINWREAFPFTNLFRTFRLAIHPSKLLLALVAVLICYTGGRFLDLVSGKQVVVEKPFYSLRFPADEIQRYISSPTMVEFYRWRDQAKEGSAQLLTVALTDSVKNPRQAKELIQSGQAMESFYATLREAQNASSNLLNESFKETRKAIDKEFDLARKTAEDKGALAAEHAQKIQQMERAADYLRLAIWKSARVAGLAINLNPSAAVDTVIRTAPNTTPQEMQKALKDRGQITRTIALSDTYDQLKASQGLGIFQASLSYGILMFNSSVDSVLSAELFFNPDFKDFDTTPETPPGLVHTLALTVQGMGWFVRVHWLYFIIYTLFSLVIWAMAGGAICRIAALHAARDEKIPLREAFSFSIRKFGSFFTAPLMPVFFIIGCCIPLLLIGVVGVIPWLGEIVVGLSFFLVLLISFALAVTIIGGVGGLGLMYPTIAVEGSDTFDAFSRSYSYIYARPWRTIFYTLVAAVYGTLCFVFVKLLVGLVFSSASAIVGATMNLKSASYAAPLGKLQAMWFSPTPSGPFFGRFFLFELNWTERLASFFLALWVFILVGLVIAFAISFFFCAYTIIYLLLRRCVDATEVDEVYTEEIESELSFTPAAPATVPATQVETATPGETTPSEPPV